MLIGIAQRFLQFFAKTGSLIPERFHLPEHSLARLPGLGHQLRGYGTRLGFLREPSLQLIYSFAQLLQLRRSHCGNTAALWLRAFGSGGGSTGGLATRRRRLLLGRHREELLFELRLHVTAKLAARARSTIRGAECWPSVDSSMVR